LVLIAIGGLLGAMPRGPPWMSAVTLPHGRNELSARRMAVLSTFRAPSLCRHGHRAFMRSAVRDLPPIIPATACHQRNDVERYSRSIEGHHQNPLGEKKRLPWPWHSSGECWWSSCPCACRRLSRSSPLWPGSNGAITARILRTKSGVRLRA